MKRLSAFFGLFAILALPAAPADAPRVLVLVDVSTPAPQEEGGDARLRAAEKWLRLLPLGRQELAVYGFDDQCRVVASFTALEREKTRDELIGQVQGVKAGGGYADLRLALETALKVFGGAAPEQGAAPRAVVLLSDGLIRLPGGKANPALNTQSAAAIEHDLLPLFAQRKIAIHSLAFTLQADRVLLHKLAKATGGRALEASAPRAFQQLHLAIFDRVLRPPDSGSRFRKFRIGAEVQAASFFLARRTAADDVELTSPDGTLYSSAQPVKRDGVKWLLTTDTAILTVAAPTPGEWTIETTLTSASQVLALTAPHVSLVIPDRSIEIGEPIQVTAALTQHSQRLAHPALLRNLAWEVWLEPIDGGTGRLLGPLKLRDAALGEGVFEARFTGDFGHGPRHLRVVAQTKTARYEAEESLECIASWLHVTLDREEGPPNLPLVLHAQVKPPGGPDDRIELKAIVGRPDGTSATVRVDPFDDFRYIEELPGFTQSGYHTITVSATSIAKNGRRFTRESRLQYLVRDPALVDVAPPLPFVPGSASSGGSNAGGSAIPLERLYGLLGLQALVFLASLVLLAGLYRALGGGAKEGAASLHDRVQSIFASAPAAAPRPRDEFKDDLAPKPKRESRRQRRRELREREESSVIEDPFAAEIAKLEADLGLSDDGTALADLPDIGQELDDDYEELEEFAPIGDETSAADEAADDELEMSIVEADVESAEFEMSAGEAESAAEGARADNAAGEAVSPDDIDLLLGGADDMNGVAPAGAESEFDDADEEEGGGDAISQDDIDQLLASAGGGPEAAAEGGAIAQDDIDLLLAAADNVADKVEAADAVAAEAAPPAAAAEAPPAEDASGGISQADIDALLAGGADDAKDEA